MLRLYSAVVQVELSLLLVAKWWWLGCVQTRVSVVGPCFPAMPQLLTDCWACMSETAQTSALGDCVCPSRLVTVGAVSRLHPLQLGMLCGGGMSAGVVTQALLFVWLGMLRCHCISGAKLCTACMLVSLVYAYPAARLALLDPRSKLGFDCQGQQVFLVRRPSTICGAASLEGAWGARAGLWGMVVRRDVGWRSCCECGVAPAS